MSRIQTTERSVEHASTPRHGHYVTQGRQRYLHPAAPSTSANDANGPRPPPIFKPAYTSPPLSHAASSSSHVSAIRHHLPGELACLACSEHEQRCYIDDGEVQCTMCQHAGRECRFERVIKCAIQFRPRELPYDLSRADLLTRSSPLLDLRDLDELLSHRRGPPLQDPPSAFANFDAQRRPLSVRQDRDAQYRNVGPSPRHLDYSNSETGPSMLTDEGVPRGGAIRSNYEPSFAGPNFSIAPMTSPHPKFGHLQHESQVRSNAFPFVTYEDTHRAPSPNASPTALPPRAGYRTLQAQRGPGPSPHAEAEPYTVLPETARPTQVQMISSSSDPVVCHLCSQSFKRKGDLTRHWQSVHASASIDCEVAECARKGPDGFHRQDHWREHMRQVHHIIRDVPSRKRGRNGGHERGRKLDVGNYIKMRRSGACEACKRSKRKCHPDHVGYSVDKDNDVNDASNDESALAEQAQKQHGQEERSTVAEEAQASSRGDDVSGAAESDEVEGTVHVAGRQSRDTEIRPNDRNSVSPAPAEK